MNITRYDRRGNEIEDVEYDAEGNLKGKKVYKYKYDRSGNYIEQTTFDLAPDGRESRLRIEEVSYYIIKYYPERKSGK
jgi:YD repeat-containing protein